jgi:hypothetical protein
VNRPSEGGPVVVHLLLLLGLVAGAKPESKVVTPARQKSFWPSIVELHAKVMIAQLWEDIACGKGGQATWCESVHKLVDEAKHEEDAILRAQAPYTKCELLWVSSASNWHAAKEIFEKVDAAAALDAGPMDVDAKERTELRNRVRDFVEAANKDQSEFDKQRCRAQ